ncbi:phage virion morphogenesis protein [Paucimonas lemoignei]|uniref:Phage virion morphogenesis protein n=1 Tax=Paucimonas lemoignei TaxID=29443 RepID=A0A4R3HZ52_PAULE|nr:phage virion morphogenesis protein [Paucimonas lemoignei]TCS38518.1 phage virion morphogenesis protein [Paucimonas lemoignei]
MINIPVIDQEVQTALKKMLDHSQDAKPAMAAISGVMLGAIEDNFRAEGRPQKWRALRSSTLAARAAAGKAGKILQATGKLAASMTPFHSNTEAGVGTNRPYAAAMHFGSKPHEIKPKNKKALAFGGKVFRRVKHPGTVARPFMVLMPNDQEDILDIAARHLMSGV